MLDPSGHVEDIVTWLGIAETQAATQEGSILADGTGRGEQGSSPPPGPSPPFTLETQVSKDTNRKYELQYCGALRRFPRLVEEHRRLSSILGERVKAFGYDLDSFPCVQGILRRYSEKNDGGERSEGLGGDEQGDAASSAET